MLPFEYHEAMKPKQPTLEDLGVSQVEYDFLCGLQNTIIATYHELSDGCDTEVDISAREITDLMLVPEDIEDRRIFDLLSMLILTTNILKEMANKLIKGTDSDEETQKICFQIIAMKDEMSGLINLVRSYCKDKSDMDKVKKNYAIAVKKKDVAKMVYYSSSLFSIIKIGLVVTLKEKGILSSRVIIVTPEMKKFIDETRNLNPDEIERN